MNTIGIIPARGGSKSIPRKNIKEFCGKPLIAWAIETALQSNLDRVLVTTDDIEIAKIAKQYGAEVPFLRPKELAEDQIAIEPVLNHALNWLKENEGYTPDAAVLLQLTNPLRNNKHINETLAIFQEKKPDSVFSVCEAIANQNPHWMITRDKGNEVQLFTGESIKQMKPRRQMLPTVYYRNDLVYVFKPKNLEEKISNLYGDTVELYITDQRYDVDINTLDDWFDAEVKFKRLFQNKKL